MGFYGFIRLLKINKVLLFAYKSTFITIKNHIKPDYESGGYKFESCRVYLLINSGL